MKPRGQVCFASFLACLLVAKGSFAETAFPPGQVADLDAAIIEVCDDLYPEHCEFFFSQFQIRCQNCHVEGKISVALFDSILAVHTEDGSVDLATMINHRSPRLALDREGVKFSHSPGCSNNDQLCSEEISSGLFFTLKITSPIEQLPQLTQVLKLLNQHYNVSALRKDSQAQTFALTGILIVQGGPPNH